MQDLTLNLSGGRTLNLSLRQNNPITLGSYFPSVKVVEVEINTTEYWNGKPTYIPKKGTLIVYTDYRHTLDGHDIPSVKFADGMAYLADLPFIAEGYIDIIEQRLDDHILDTEIHVTGERESFWNNKLNYSIDGENLQFNRN